MKGAAPQQMTGAPAAQMKGADLQQMTGAPAAQMNDRPSFAGQPAPVISAKRTSPAIRPVDDIDDADDIDDPRTEGRRSMVRPESEPPGSAAEGGPSFPRSGPVIPPKAARHFRKADPSFRRSGLPPRHGRSTKGQQPSARWAACRPAGKHM